ncbi:uncharacterized protein DFL_009147 [Arthrobotrys flagrans]|uniref:Uncharacterized protein n=1 Tax=Arthrobotrys flagrans TaxID=97331 RepID=A0A436ZQT7_ARTFL|nr:hypothetical protein DFL_009147 [Arthrobotrys flagrans]
MFHSRKSKNIKDLPAYSSLRASGATKPVAEKPEAKDTGSAQKRKLGTFSEDNDLQSDLQLAKRIRRAKDLVAKLESLNEKGPKGLADTKNTPVTPQNKVLGDLKIRDYTTPKTTGSDKAIRLLVEERMNKEAKYQGLPERTRAIVLNARCHAEEKKAKVEELKTRRANVERWASFRNRLERGRLPADRHLWGPMLLGEKRVTRGWVDQEDTDKDVQDILKRWSAVVEGMSKAPVSPREDREAAEGAAEKGKKGPAGPAFDALRAKFERGEIKKKEMVKKVSDELTKANIVRLTAKYEALMADHERAFDEVVKAERELLELRGKVAKLPIGNSRAVAEFAEEIIKSSTKVVEEVGKKEKVLYTFSY